ncbi:MAG TPA: formyltetrahydrofolate deformylase [Candidatus Nanoarchaeia archaeon]|nr:formyltetrahydrofolate deformylase [Candidatus Nanoarchaeia archaeon]
MESAILKISCRDRKGLIAGITNFVYSNSGNIITLGEFVDPETKLFFMRIEWELNGFKIKTRDLPREIGKLAEKLGFSDLWEIFYSDIKPRMAIFVSKYDHCLYDLLLRHKAGELKCDIPLIVSNHQDLKKVADAFKVDFKHIPSENKEESEKMQLELLKKCKIDFIVLARYMQVLSKDFVSHFESRIINIHHSFLPAFEGAKAYHQAHERGVKIIGATSHFVIKTLDQGPIIQQGVVSASHKDTIDDLMTKGRDIERTVLADAVKLFIEHRIFVSGNRTVIL